LPVNPASSATHLIFPNNPPKFTVYFCQRADRFKNVLNKPVSNEPLKPASQEQIAPNYNTNNWVVSACQDYWWWWIIIVILLSLLIIDSLRLHRLKKLLKERFLNQKKAIKRKSKPSRKR
jgi:hypothetical protein